MINKSTRSLILAASLFILPTSFQSVLAADLNGLAKSSIEKVNTATKSAETASSINVNTASLTQLTSISGIGSKTAQAIVEYREKYGDFTNLQDLTKVKGIGVSTLAKILPYLSL